MKNDLLELAVRAYEDVKGPWRATAGNEVRGDRNICVAGGVRTDALTRYLAALDPETMLKLLQELEALRACAEDLTSAESSGLSAMAMRSKLRGALRGAT